MAANFQWHASSTSGTKKPENDDSWAVFSAGMTGSENLPSEGTISNAEKDIIFAVSDGMGGGNAGYLASSLILQNISQIIPQTFKAAAQGFHPDYLEQLELAVEKIHAEINAAGDKNEAHTGMGATLTLAWFTPENLYLAHIGDSRLYLHRDGLTTQLSLDHALVWKKLQRKELSEIQYRSHPRRSVLYQVVGAGNRNVKPQIAAIPYQPGDQFMLCSDGITDGVWEKNIHSAFLKQGPDPATVHQSILTRALENDGTDDTTMINLTVT
ncbi:MAG: PP2C family protein-serine/threonine phosphatase [Akkermansiaceae bacterium]